VIDLQTIQLFEASTIDDYSRIKCTKALEAVLADTGWSIDEVRALACPFDLLVVARAGIVECREPGMFKKRIEVGGVLPWGDIASVVKTEPTLRVYGIEVRGADDGALRAFQWSGDGAHDDHAERNRIYDALVAGAGS
jgi:hypothetical protein